MTGLARGRVRGLLGTIEGLSELRLKINGGLVPR